MIFEERGHPPKHNNFPKVIMLGLHLINAGLSPEFSWISGGALSHEQESECIPNSCGCGLYSLPLFNFLIC